MKIDCGQRGKIHMVSTKARQYMIKHWILFDDIVDSQKKQLQTAKIFYRISKDVSYFDFPPDSSRVPFVKNQKIQFTTVSESQETLLRLMFVDNIKLIGYNDDNEIRY
jgi:hypothetical protein